MSRASKDDHRRYQRVLMRRRRLWAKVKDRYAHRADDLGRVPIRAVERFTWHGREFRPGQTCLLPWRWAALLERGTFAEPAPTPTPAPRETLASVRELLAVLKPDAHS